jgi:hypothetical protein
MNAPRMRRNLLHSSSFYTFSAQLLSKSFALDNNALINEARLAQTEILSQSNKYKH